MLIENINLSKSWHKNIIATDGYIFLGMLDEAEKEIMNLPVSDKNKEEAYIYLNRIYLIQEKYDKAEENILKGLITYKDSVELKIQWMYVLENTYRKTLSAAVYRNIPQNVKENGMVFYNLACMYSISGKEYMHLLEDVLKLNPLLKKSVEIDPDFKKLYF